MSRGYTPNAGWRLEGLPPVETSEDFRASPDDPNPGPVRTFEDVIPSPDDPNRMRRPKWQSVTPAEIKTSPWRALCYIEVRNPFGNRQTGTGWLAGEHLVITAAHVVAPSWTGARTEWEIMLSSTGTKEVVGNRNVRIHDKYTGDTSSPYDPFDIAAVFVPTLQASPLNFGLPSVSQASVEIAGFPGAESKILVTHSGMMTKPDATLLLHRVDTVDGHSGAPVISREGSQNRMVIGLHIAGEASNPYRAKADLSPYNVANVALAMNDELMNFIRYHVLNFHS